MKDKHSGATVGDRETNKRNQPLRRWLAVFARHQIGYRPMPIRLVKARFQSLSRFASRLIHGGRRTAWIFDSDVYPAYLANLALIGHWNFLCYPFFKY